MAGLEEVSSTDSGSLRSTSRNKPRPGHTNNKYREVTGLNINNLRLLEPVILLPTDIPHYWDLLLSHSQYVLRLC